jgi:Holliday junction resolvasome RuvABC endonuclease subunit
MVVIAPGTLKKEATGNGRASKPEMLAKARETFPECPNHDVADAYFLARLAYDCYEDLVEEEVS